MSVRIESKNIAENANGADVLSFLSLNAQNQQSTYKNISSQDVLAMFRASGALLDGHFILSSGLHSRQYLQCARVLMDTTRASILCAALASRIAACGVAVDAVVSPAMGGVIVGYETARHLQTSAMFLERVEGVFCLRRGFEVAPNSKIVMVEDIVTTGLSSREAMAAIGDCGGEVVAAACLIDRSGGTAQFDVPFVSLATLDVETFDSDHIPTDIVDIAPIKPGSRSLQG